MVDKILVARVTSEFRKQMIDLLKSEEDQGRINGLAVMDDKGEKTIGVLVPPDTYNIYRAIEDTFEHPDKHGLKIKLYWDQGPGCSLEQVLGKEPLTGFQKFRQRFYEKRVKFYRAVHIRPALTL